MVCKDVLPFCGLPLYSVKRVFWWRKVLNFYKVQFVYFSFVAMPLVSHPRDHCQIQCHQAFVLWFLPRISLFWVLHLGPWSTLSWFLHKGLGKGPNSFCCMWISRFPSTVLLKRLSFIPFNNLGTLVENHLTIYLWGLFLGSLFYSMDPSVCLHANTTLHWLL